MSDEKLAAPRCCNTRRFLHWGFWTSCRNLLFYIMNGRLQIIATVPYLYYSLLQQNPEAKMERWLAILFSRSVKLFVAKQYRIYPRQVISNISAISRTEKRVETSPFFWNLTIISHRIWRLLRGIMAIGHSWCVSYRLESRMRILLRCMRFPVALSKVHWKN